MYITFSNNKIRKICEDKKTATRKLGKQMSEKLFQRIAEMRASDNLAVLRSLPSPNCHPLIGNLLGCYAVYLVHPMRLIFVPSYEGEFKEESITEVVIKEIIDYH